MGMKMINILKYAAIALLLAGIIFSCSESGNETCYDNEESLEGETFHYYSFGEKYYTKQTKNKIVLKFTQDADEKQLYALVGSDPCLRLSQKPVLSELSNPRYALLESKDGNAIPFAVLETFKWKPEVLSAEYLLGTSTGMMDTFAVMLKETTSYAQLQELAELYNCTIKKIDDFMDIKNWYNITCFKTSEWNAIQLSALFYETGLIELTSLGGIAFNAFDSGYYFGHIYDGVKSTPEIRQIMVEH